MALQHCINNDCKIVKVDKTKLCHVMYLSRQACMPELSGNIPTGAGGLGGSGLVLSNQLNWGNSYSQIKKWMQIAIFPKFAICACFFPLFLPRLFHPTFHHPHSSSELLETTSNYIPHRPAKLSSTVLSRI